MPQDPDLYGQRPPKRQKKSSSSALPSSLAFKSELSSLISTSKTPSIIPPSTTQARPRPSKSKPDIFATVKAKRKADNKTASQRTDDKLILKDVTTTEEEKNAHLAARRKMEDKARLYAAMKRGDYVPKEGEAAPLVDFDRKWAEAQDSKTADAATSSDEDDDDDTEDDTEIITFTDEFGRARTGTRGELARIERRVRASQYGAAELEAMSVRPRAPDRIIYGDAVQAEAFVAADELAMEAMARKRDRSLTPPEMKHYDANGEIRTKGVGFFQFSKDEQVRQAEMESLAKERETTEKERVKREEERAVRKREVQERRRVIEERRRAVGEKRAARMADSFLDGLAADMEGAKEKDEQ